jgi:hypothetical protein
MNETTAITTTTRTMPAIPTLDKVQAVQALVTMACKSGMSKAKNPADAFFIAMYGIELGIPPITALRTIYSVAGGAPTCSGEAMLSLLRGSGKVKIGVPDPGTVKDKATVKMERIDTGEKAEFTFTMEMANRAGLVKSGGNWSKYPQMMLIWRAVSMGAKLLCSDIIGGLYTYEEINPDMPVDETGAPVIVDDPNVTDAEYTEIEPEPPSSQPTPPVPAPDKLHIGKLIEAVTFMYDHGKHAANSVNKLLTEGVITEDMHPFEAIKAVVLHRAVSDYQMDEAQVLEAIRATNEDDTIADYAAFLKTGHKHSDVWTAVKEYHTLINSKPAAPKSEAEQFAADHNLTTDAPPVRQNDDDDGIPF